MVGRPLWPICLNIVFKYRGADEHLISNAIINIPEQTTSIDFQDLWNNHLRSNNPGVICPMCFNGLKQIIKYDFGPANYLLMSFVNGIDEDGIKLAQFITNHPEEYYRLQGTLASGYKTCENISRHMLEGYYSDISRAI